MLMLQRPELCWGSYTPNQHKPAVTRHPAGGLNKQNRIRTHRKDEFLLTVRMYKKT